MIINHGVRGSIPTSGPFTAKYGGSTPCVEILTKNVQIIFDCGSGFSKVKINDSKPTIILLSHFHHDHLQGLPFNPTLLFFFKTIFMIPAIPSGLYFAEGFVINSIDSIIEEGKVSNKSEELNNDGLPSI